MVILSAAICTKSGKTLLARQFVAMTRTKIEGLLGAFPKLIEGNKQHTFIEAGNFRYVYQPMEDLYLILVTLKSANIVENLDTLNLLASIVSHFSPTMTETAILDKAYDIIFGFDEAISVGHRENVKLDQILSFLDMESTAEKMELALEQTKIKRAKEHMNQVAKELATFRTQNPGKNFRGGISNEDSGAALGIVDLANTFASPSSPITSYGSAKATTPSSKAAPAAKPKGMSLKSAAPTQSIVQQMLKTGEIDEDEIVPVASPSLAADFDEAPLEGVQIKVVERMVVSASKEGDVESIEIKGELLLTAADSDHGNVKVQLKKGRATDKIKYTPNTKYVNKELFQADQLALKKGQVYPPKTTVPVLKWHIPKPDESLVPISLTTFREKSADGVEVNLDYTLEGDRELKNVVFKIPVEFSPTVTEIEGSFRYDENKGFLHWIVEDMSESNSSGNLIFSVPEGDEDSFFPIEISYESESLMSGISIADVVGETGSTVKFTSSETFVGLQTLA